MVVSSSSKQPGASICLSPMSGRVRMGYLSSSTPPGEDTKKERVKPDTDSAWLRLTCQVGQLLGEGPLEDVSTQHRACRVHVNSAHV